MNKTSGTRSGHVAFAPQARLLKLIGAELISDDVLAITELVKNAYDADASSVWIEFHAVTGDAGVITVWDDGHGVNLDAFLERWMAPASTLKASKRGRRSPGGRRVLGEKGVGRFAVDKLARELELRSRTHVSSKELHATFDWDAFDRRDAKLDDIQVHWKLGRAEVLTAPGTVLRLIGVRTRWTERMFRRLCNRLARLRPPFEHSGNDFEIVIESDEFPDYSGQIQNRYLDRAPYRIDARFDGEQMVRVQINGAPASEHLWNGSAGLACGPVRLRLYGFDLETDSLALLGPRVEARAWLRQWSGVSLYRDGFRVWPYGEPQDDWLRLDQRRVNNPTVCLSNNQVVGFIEISRDGNPGLFDQTNREGLVENHACLDLRRLARFVLQQLEAERHRIRHPASNTPGPADHASDTAHAETSDALRRLGAHLEQDREGKKLVDTLRRHLERDRSRHGERLEVYTELASLGQSTLEFSTAALPLLERARSACAALENATGTSNTRGTDALSILQTVLESLQVQLVPLSNIDNAASYRSRHTDVAAELRRFQQAIDPRLKERGVRCRLVVKAKRTLLATMRPESLHRLMHILLANSLDWLHRIDRPAISLTVTDDNDFCIVDFTDNGPGIPGPLLERVFDPAFSGREGGRGMGLTIASDIVKKLKGQVAVKRRSRGATIRLQLPVRKRRIRP